LLYAKAGSGLALGHALRGVMSGGAVRIDLNYHECDGEDEQQSQQAELEGACGAHPAGSSEEPRSEARGGRARDAGAPRWRPRHAVALPPSLDAARRRPATRGVYTIEDPALILPEVLALDTSFVVEALIETQPLHAVCAGFVERIVEAAPTVVTSELLEVELAEAAFAIALKERWVKGVKTTFTQTAAL
jgi:hypothetical protein